MDDISLLETIRDLPSLKPSPKVNTVFSQLVTFCTTSTATTLNNKQIQFLRETSGEAECEMELFWAHKIISSPNPKGTLRSFWYYTNYEELVELEYVNVCTLLKKIRAVLFIGGGALPLTAILLYNKYALHSTVLEKDLGSYNLAKKLIQSLGLQNYITVLNVDAKEYHDYAKFDVIYIAALAGLKQTTKSKIIQIVDEQVKIGTLIICRGAHGIRTLLYPPLQLRLPPTMQPILEVRPHSKTCINSFVVLKKT